MFLEGVQSKSKKEFQHEKLFSEIIKSNFFSPPQPQLRQALSSPVSW